MKLTLIGSTGLVGSSIQEFIDFDVTISGSSPIERLATDVLVCAAPSAVKWQANIDPEGDWMRCENLLRRLVSIRAKRVFLISTVDVYQNTADANELSPITDSPGYGSNRYRLEMEIRKLDWEVCTIRLAGLVSPKLKKNPLYDMKHRNNLHMLNRNSKMQFIPLLDFSQYLAENIAESWPEVLNVTSPPVDLASIAGIFDIQEELAGESVASYNVQTCKLPNKQYFYDDETSLHAIANYAYGVR